MPAQTPQAEVVRARMYLGGQWVDAGDREVFHSINPTTEQSLASIPVATADDVDAAARAACAAAPEWSGLPWQERSARLRELAARVQADAPRLAELDARDAGFPIAAMRRDVAIGADWLHYFAGIAGEVKGVSFPGGASQVQFTAREPYPVSARIVPYNHPAMFAIQKSAAPLAAGSCVILKPAEHTSLSALAFAELADGVLPPGVLSVLTGTGARTGAALVAHPAIRRVAFTGSVASGKAVLRAAAEQLKHVTLELGGKNPLIVFPEVDLAAAVAAAVQGMNLRESAGQSCRSTSRVFVHAEVYQEFVQRLASAVAALRVGDPLHPDTDVGPLAFGAHYDRVLGHIDSAVREGARVVVGGGRPPSSPRGLFVAPTVFADVRPDMRIAREEIFGPVLAVIPWQDADEMLSQVNDLEYGLTANVWTDRLRDAHRVAAGIQAGTVWINGTGRIPSGVPFGGYKHSGIGKEGALEELLSYTQEKSILMTVG
ncbi:MAG TPA: aldehyde dehydrogenase family protein [Nakamurella sp.]|nr:aldehyde dehydrogenase family protein [Nakamurella sp.]